LENINGGPKEQASQQAPATTNLPSPKTEQKTEQDYSTLPQDAESARARRAAGESWTNLEIRNYYNARNAEIAALDVQWQQEGKTLEQRARLASELRHGMRMTTRDMMGDPRLLLGLLVRDAAKYGD